MLYFKDGKGCVFGYETEKEREEWGADDLVLMSEAEVSTHLNPEPPALASSELCAAIDYHADIARTRVAGDPLRAVEYDRAAAEAHAYASAGYQGDVPPMVAAWAINGRTAREAADDILHEAAQYTAALIALRETRLAAKEQVRALMDAGEVEQAQQVVEHTVAAIEAAVAGVGNAAA